MEHKIVEHFNKWWWGSTFTLIADQGHGIVEVQLDDNYPSIAFVKGLSVLESERRKGLGKKLLDQCVILALREQKQLLQLSVNKEKVNESTLLTANDTINRKYLLVQKGKKNYYVIVIQ